MLLGVGLHSASTLKQLTRTLKCEPFQDRGRYLERVKVDHEPLLLNGDALSSHHLYILEHHQGKLPSQFVVEARV